MSADRLIRVETNLEDMKGKTTINGGGQFFIDKDGFSNVPLSVAAECYKHPNYRIVDDADVEAVKEFMAISIQTENGLYDAGPIVRIECQDMAGHGTAAPDGAKVFFNKEGFAACGINTARALLAIIPSLVIEGQDEAIAAEKARVAEAATATPPADTGEGEGTGENEGEGTGEGEGTEQTTPPADPQEAAKAATKAKAAATRAANKLKKEQEAGKTSTTPNDGNDPQ